MTTFGDSVRRLCAIIIGLVFFCAGLLKLQDPVGAGLVVREYFKFFGTGFLEPSAKAVAWAMALLETLVGCALIAGIWRRIVAAVTSLMLLFFTVITAILVIKNPAMDCGCFGEAIHLTHWQTLLKNLILCVLAAISFLPVKAFAEKKTKIRKVVAFVLAAGAVLSLSVHTLIRLPSVDFTDFAPGTELDAAASVDDIDDIRDSLFIYSRGDSEGAFRADRLPDGDWEYVEATPDDTDQHPFGIRTVALPVRDADGVYCNEMLAIEDVAIVSVYSPEKFGFEEWQDVADAVQEMQMAGLSAYLLMPDASEAPMELTDFALSADRKTLMTLNRSNGGVTALHDGDIIAKWAFRHSPVSNEWESILKRNPVEFELSRSSKGRIALEAVTVYSLALLLLI